MTEQLTPTRPYLLRAMHEWMSDNGQTPLVVIDATMPDVTVPGQHVADGRIILNISWSATQGLVIGNDAIVFSARFSGAPFQVTVPIDAVQGIYARESGQGMMFQDEPGGALSGDDAGDGEGGNGDNKPRGRGGLRVVK
jgi:stringent starvation protein B